MSLFTEAENAEHRPQKYRMRITECGSKSITQKLQLEIILSDFLTCHLIRFYVNAFDRDEISRYHFLADSLDYQQTTSLPLLMHFRNR